MIDAADQAGTSAPPLTVVDGSLAGPKPGSAATFLFRTASFVARPDTRDECRNAIAELVAAVECNEPGTHFIASFESAADPNTMLLALVFADERAERAHHESIARRRFDDAMNRLTVLGVRRQEWRPGIGL